MYLLNANMVYVCALGYNTTKHYRKIIIEIKFRIEAGRITTQQQARDVMAELVKEPSFKFSSPIRALYCKGSKAANAVAAD